MITIKKENTLKKNVNDQEKKKKGNENKFRILI